jgi:uncharacterized protein (DUF302 family)
MSSYGYLRSIDSGVDKILDRLPALLERDGLIIVSSIDVAGILKERLNIDYRRYHILGVANPPHLLKALDAEQEMGLLLPYNIVVFQKPGGGSIVGTVKLTTLLQISGNDELREVTHFLESKLKMIIDEI